MPEHLQNLGLAPLIFVKNQMPRGCESSGSSRTIPFRLTPILTPYFARPSARKGCFPGDK